MFKPSELNIVGQKNGGGAIYPPMPAANDGSTCARAIDLGLVTPSTPAVVGMVPESGEIWYRFDTLFVNAITDSSQNTTLNLYLSCGGELLATGQGQIDSNIIGGIRFLEIVGAGEYSLTFAEI